MNDLYEKKKKSKKAGTESSKESSLRDWFGRKGAKGSKKGWVDCNSPDGSGGYKACGRSGDEKRKKYPACRPTPGACKERGKGKSWGKKAKSKKNEELYMDLEQIIDEELETILDEKEGKKDACYHKVKSRYKVWPSAYASGALVKCRKVGAKNWGNSKKEALNITIEDELTQFLNELKCWDGHQRVKGKTPGEPGSCEKIKEEISDLKSKVIKALRDEGGAAGMKALKKHTKASEEEINKIISSSDNIKVHEDGDIILMDSIEEKKKKKACKPSKGKRFAKRVDGKCRSFGQKGQAKGGGDRIRPGTKKGDAYCARSAKIKKCKNPPCANALSRKKWKCRGSKSMKE
jgi:ElaB/YqjD/DUF883 family membrane-anchored ribosome-binding protein